MNVYKADAVTLPWLKLITTDRNKPFGNGTSTGEFGITPPIPVGACLPERGRIRQLWSSGLISHSHAVSCDDQQVAFVTKDCDPGDGDVSVYRVIGYKNGKIFGGYSIVIVGSQSPIQVLTQKENQDSIQKSGKHKSSSG